MAWPVNFRTNWAFLHLPSFYLNIWWPESENHKLLRFRFLVIMESVCLKYSNINQTPYERSFQTQPPLSPRNQLSVMKPVQECRFVWMYRNVMAHRRRSRADSGLQPLWVEIGDFQLSIYPELSRHYTVDVCENIERWSQNQRRYEFWDSQHIVWHGEIPFSDRMAKSNKSVSCQMHATSLVYSAG